MGRIAKYQSRIPTATSITFPQHLRQELVDWIHSLPPHLQLPIGSSRTDRFDRDVHQLHLPYLTTIIILYLKRSPNDLPHALPPAILAASCIARILRDILARGNTRFLMAITCWYAGMAFIALLQACRMEQIATEAEHDLDVVDAAVGQLQKMWASADIMRQGFTRLRSTRTCVSGSGTGQPTNGNSESIGHASEDPGIMADQITTDEFDWTLLFPFVSPSTNRIAECLLANEAAGFHISSADLSLNQGFLPQYQDMFEIFTNYNFDFPDVGIY